MTQEEKLSDTKFQEIFNRVVALVFDDSAELTAHEVKAIIKREFGEDADKFAVRLQKQGPFLGKRGRNP